MARGAVLTRTDDSLLSQWWWRTDRLTLIGVISLMIIGAFMVLAASGSVGDRIGLGSLYFVKRHILYVAVGVGVMVLTSMQSVMTLRRLALIIFILALIGTYMTIFIGSEIKGARRWINLGPFSLQPSEFLKPTLVILVAWMIHEKKKNIDLPGNAFALIFYALVALGLVLQPDMGMLVLVTATFLIQLFLGGLPIVLIAVAGGFSFIAVALGYLFFPHVQGRIGRFLAPATADRFSERYQISKSLDAFTNGGFWGLGPGEGVVKKNLPDAHADFIFSVLAEEYGLIACSLVAMLIFFVIIRPIMLCLKNNNVFQLLVVAGLSIQIGLQAFINMASTLDLIPTKGMTLPFYQFWRIFFACSNLKYGIHPWFS